MSFDVWRERSQLNDLRGVIDPGDKRGYKNQYIDRIHRDALEQWCRIAPGDAALDFGCGTGRFTTWLAERAGWVCGMDIVPEMVQVALQRHRRLNVSWLVGTGLALPYRDASFDWIMTIFVLQHILDEDALAMTLREFGRVLKPNGHVVLMEQVSAKRTRTIKEYNRHRLVESYENALVTAGLKLHGRVPLRAHSLLTHAVAFGLVPMRWLKYAAAVDARLASSRLNFSYKDFLLLATKST